MADKRTVYHPTFPDVTRVVSSDVEKDWKAAGWRFTPIPDPEPEAAPEPAGDGGSE